MSTIRQIFFNTIAGWLAVFAQAALALLVVPLLLTHLGKEGYGLVGLLGVVVSLAGVADLGLRGALGRELSEQVARNNLRAFNELTNTAFLLYLVIALCLAGLGYGMAPWLVKILNVPPLMQTQAVLLIRAYASGAVVLSFITPVFSAALSAHNRFDLVNNVKTVGSLLSGGLMFIVIPRVSDPLLGWVCVMLGYQIILLFLQMGLFFRFCVGVRMGVSYLNISRLRSLFHLGGYMYALQLTQALSERSDPLVISAFFGPAGVALYQPGGRLSQVVRPIVTTLAEQMYPLTTRQHVSGNSDSLKKILLLGTRYTIMSGILFSVGLLVFAEPFCRLWLSAPLGVDYHVVAQIMMGWALVDMMMYAAGTQWPILLGMKRLQFLLWTQLPTGVLNILVSIYLVGYAGVGIPGVLVATILIGLIRRPILMVYTARQCGVSAKTYFKEAYYTPIICFVITLIGAFGSKTLIPVRSYITLGLCVMITTTIWFVSCWFVGMECSERGLVGVKITQYLRRHIK